MEYSQDEKDMIETTRAAQNSRAQEEWKRQLPNIARAFGGNWCNCIDDVIGKITPKRLAVFCEAQGLRATHEPLQDELGIRYTYQLTSQQIREQVGNDEIIRTQNIVADFGDFTHRPLETLQSTLRAIIKISSVSANIKKFVTPHEIALMVAEEDELKAPAVKKTSADLERQMPSSRSFAQTQNGLRPI